MHRTRTKRFPCSRVCAPRGVQQNAARPLDRHMCEPRVPSAHRWQCALVADTLWQLLFFEAQADAVAARIGKLLHPFHEAEDKQHCHISSDEDAGVALFDLKPRRLANRRPLRRDGDWNPPPTARISNVVAELAQGPYHR